MKILVISMAGIGDTLIATPLIHELRANFPDATIDVLAMWAGAKDLLEHNPHVNRVFQKNLMKCGKLEALRFLWSLRRDRYQLSINTHPQSRIHYRFAARGWRARDVRISHEYECFSWLDRWLVTGTLPQDYSRHSIENNFDVLPLIGVQEETAGARNGDFSDAGRGTNWRTIFWRGTSCSGKKVLGIHVGSGGTKNLPLKRWPLKNYAGLVRQLNQRAPGHPRFALWRAGRSEGPSGRAGAGKPGFDAGGEDKKSARDGGADEAVQRVFERGHGVDAHRGRVESAEPNRHRSADAERDELALRKRVHTGEESRW